MSSFYFWSAPEIEEFIKTLEMAIASGATSTTSPNGSITYRGRADMQRALNLLYAAYRKKTGKGPGGYTGGRVTEVVIQSPDRPNRPLGRRRSGFDAY